MQAETAPIFELITAPQNGALRHGANPAWLWSRTRKGPLWANGAALRLWGAEDHAGLLRQASPERQPGLARLESIAGSLPLRGSRIERIRLFLDGRDRNLTCRCSWLATTEERLLVVSVLDAPQPARGAGRDPAQAARDLLAGFAGPAVALAADGRLLFANSAAPDIDADALGLGQLAARAAAEGRASLPPGTDGAARAADAVAVETAPQGEAIVAVLLGEVPARAAEPAQPVTGAAEPAHEEESAEDVPDETPPPAPEETAPRAEPPEARRPQGRAEAEEPPFTDVIFKPRWDDRTPERPAGIGPREAAGGAAERAGKILPFRGFGPFVPADENDLAAHERDAFRALAEALGARMEGDEEARRPAPAAPRKASERRSAAAHGPIPDLASGEAAALLSRLPIGLMVYRRTAPLYANRAFLDLFGFAGFAELAEFGDVTRLLPRMEGDSDVTSVDAPVDPSKQVTLFARDLAGRAIPVIARLQAVRWGGEGAILLTVRSPDQAPAQPGEEAAEAAFMSPAEAEHALALAADGTVILDRDGRITALDGRARHLFGRSETEACGERFETLFAEESRAVVADYLDGLGQHGVASVLGSGRNVRARTAQGAETPVHLVIGRLGDAPERRYCAVVRDISQWVRNEAELTRARQTAESASRQKSEFLARISHEIRTPLNSIIGFSEVILQERFGAVGNERYRDYIQDILSSGRHVLGLVNDLLDLSKVEAGKLELNFTGVDVNEIAVECIRLMLNEAARGRVIVRSSLGRHLPPVVADQRSLKQILLNLLSNAIKFTLPGGQVVLSTRLTEGGEVQIRVRDTGVGMEQQDIALAMEPFRQVATAPAPRTPGAGLGLPLTKALAHANRARFHIESRSGHGTLTEVTFPPQRVLAE